MTASVHTETFPPPPRPVTPRVARRAWAEPLVRFWAVAAAVVAAAGVYLCASGYASWRHAVWLIEHGTPVTAKAVEVDGEAEAGLASLSRRKPPDSPVVLEFNWQNQRQQVHGFLDGRTDYVGVGDKIPIRIDPQSPEVWTARTTRPPLGLELFGGLIALGLAVPVFATAVLLRGRVLRTWRQGDVVEATVVGEGQSALAPRSRAVRCTLDSGAHAGGRVLTVYVPPGGDGEMVKVLVRDRARPLAIAWFE